MQHINMVRHAFCLPLQKQLLFMRIYLILILLFLFSSFGIAQVQFEVNPPEHIKTIEFKGEAEDQFPVVRLGESMLLRFDDISAREDDYYYKIVHCDYDWTPSKLLKSQYLRGMDNQRISNYENSYNTLQPYSHYKLTIPNQDVRLKVSGNYLLEVYNDIDEIQFSRRFIVYKDQVKVSGVVKRSRDFTYLNEKQVVQFTINTANAQLVNPKKEVKIAILQNHYWPSALYNIAPQFILGSKLTYKYDQETSFYGGNEFLNFDTKDLRAPSSAIASIELTEIYNHYLFTNRFRDERPYTYYPDINGDFAVRTLQGRDSNREAEYSYIHFSLPYTEKIGLDPIFVTGKFNNYALEEENKMNYNENNGKMEIALKMKQGFYNYKYVIKRENEVVDLNTVSGNFHFTENYYLILVYYRNFGDLYDSIIGIGSASSLNISN